MSVVLGVLALTSKDSAGVTGSGFITLAATLACASHYRDLGWRQTVRRPRDVFTERRDTCADLVPDSEVRQRRRWSPSAYYELNSSFRELRMTETGRMRYPTDERSSEATSATVSSWRVSDRRAKGAMRPRSKHRLLLGTDVLAAKRAIVLMAFLVCGLALYAWLGYHTAHCTSGIKGSK